MYLKRMGKRAGSGKVRGRRREPKRGEGGPHRRARGGKEGRRLGHTPPHRKENRVREKFSLEHSRNKQYRGACGILARRFRLEDSVAH